MGSICTEEMKFDPMVISDMALEPKLCCKFPPPFFFFAFAFRIRMHLYYNHKRDNINNFGQACELLTRFFNLRENNARLTGYKIEFHVLRTWPSSPNVCAVTTGGRPLRTAGRWPFV